MQNLTEKIITESISELNTVFVFPTGISANLWAEKTLEFAHINAVAKERFIAWDDFKSESIRSTRQNKESIPSVVRKLFTKKIIAQNADLCSKGEEPLFTSLINPIYASDASTFTDWISSLLPSLENWMQYNPKCNDAEDKDLRTLHSLYKEFLQQQDLFDPAWESPPFDNQGYNYIIFYPEVLTDFTEYAELLSESQHIKIINIPAESPDIQTPVHTYTNSRTELRETALFIRNLVDTKKCAYNEIAISVPDIETYAPYIKQEMELYQIPIDIRSGKTLSAYGAGLLFVQIQACIAEDFSFNSVKELLLNAHLPWNAAETNKRLIEFGIKNNCICSYEEDGKKIDSWEQALKKDGTALLELNLYTSVKKAVQSFKGAKNFAEISSCYFAFKEKFFTSDFSELSDSVLGQCLSTLASLADIEKTFADLIPENPFDFFVSQIKQKDYLPQTHQMGVYVFPYKLVSSAPFKCHIIIDASQSSLNILFKQLAFLRQDKREALQLTDENPSVAFIQLYKQHSTECFRFSASIKNFTGYTIPHNYFAEEKKHPQLPNDFVIDEVQHFQSDSATPASMPVALSTLQKDGFNIWQENKDIYYDRTYFIPEAVQERIKAKIFKDSNITVSESAMYKFYVCPRLWIFDYILKMEEQTLEMNLLQDRWIGSVYHAIIEKFLKAYKENNIPLKPIKENDREETKERLSDISENVIKEYDASVFTKNLLLSQKNALVETTLNFLSAFMDTYTGFSVYKLEEKYTVNLPDQNINLTGRIDCILSDPNGALFIVDYKTNQTPSIKSCFPNEDGKLENFQMAMYSFLLLNSDLKTAEISGADFFSIKKMEPTRIIKEDTDITPMLTAFNKAVTNYVDSIKKFSFEEISNVPYQTCSGCAYQKVCRKYFTVSGR